MIVNGLSWWQSWLCVWIGYTIAACFVCMTGRIGATYHIGFPVINRSSFGIWGSLWPVFNRAAMGRPYPTQSMPNGLLTRGYSLYLVWGPGLYRGSLCLPYDPRDLVKLGE
jgi:hypothetical protein